MELIDNRYKLNKILADDLKNTSYLAADLWEDGKRCKLKLYNDIERYKGIIAYFMDNFITIKSVRHENLLKSEKFNIVKNIDGRKVNITQYYSIIEYTSAPTLDKVKNKLSIEEKLYIILQLCIALDYLHFRGIVYIYLSPSNVYITKDRRIKLRDLAIIQEIAINKDYDYLTRYFTSEEVLFGQGNINEKSDFYSLGMMIRYLFQDDFCLEVNEPFHVNKIYRFTEEQKTFLERQVLNFTKRNAPNRFGNLQEFISDMIRIFDLDYEYDIVKERENINFKTKIIGRQKEIEQILEVDDSFQLKNYN